MPEPPVQKEMSSKLLSPIVTRKYVSAGVPQVPCQKQSCADPEPCAVAAVEYLSEEWLAGHRLGLQLDGKWTKHRCDHCGNFILGLLHAWHACRDCSYKVHARCALSQPLLRRCAHLRIREHAAFTLQICRERGLAAQRFKCAECAIYVLPEASWWSRGALYEETSAVRRPRLCDYTGQYYCTVCCCDRTAVIPARVLHNWDFRAYTVSQAAFQFLELMNDLPVLDISSIHPGLFTMVEELGHARELRRELHHMDAYLRLCPDPAACSHLRQVRGRLHLVSQPQLYSLRDLADLQRGLLLILLKRLRRHAQLHFSACQLCVRIGNYCVICRSRDCWLLPFQQGVSACGRCKRLLHTACRPLPHSGLCPRCDVAVARGHQAPAGAASEEKADATAGSGSATTGGATSGTRSNAGGGTAGGFGGREGTADGSGPGVGRGARSRTATLDNDTAGGKEKVGAGAGSLCGLQSGVVTQEPGAEAHSQSEPAPSLGIDTWEDVHIRSFRAMLEIGGRLLTSSGLSEMVFHTPAAEGSQQSEMTFPFRGMYVPVDGALYRALSAHLSGHEEAGPLAPLDKLALAGMTRRSTSQKPKSMSRAGGRPVLPQDCATAVVLAHTANRRLGQMLGIFGENPSGCQGRGADDRSHAEHNSVGENRSQRNTGEQLVIEDASSLFRGKIQRVRNVGHLSKAEMDAASKDDRHVSVQGSIGEMPANQHKPEMKYKPNGTNSSPKRRERQSYFAHCDREASDGAEKNTSCAPKNTGQVPMNTDRRRTHSRGPNGCSESTKVAPAPDTSKASSCQPWADCGARANRERLEYLFRQRRMASAAGAGANERASVNRGVGAGLGVGQLAGQSPDGAASDSGDDDSSEASVSTVVTVRAARGRQSSSLADCSSLSTSEAAGVCVGGSASPTGAAPAQPAPPPGSLAGCGSSAPTGGHQPPRSGSESAAAADTRGSRCATSARPVPPTRSAAGNGGSISASEPRGRSLFQVFAEGLHRAYNPTAEDARHDSLSPPRPSSGQACVESGHCPAQRERGLRLLPAGSGRIGHRPVGWDPRAEGQRTLASL